VDVHLRFLPAPADTGVVFLRADLGPNASIPASIERVTGTHRRTTLGTSPVCVTLVEHVLAALAGLRIDNCYVELNAPEPPGLDGSALGFVRVLHEAGVVLQTARRTIVSVGRKTVVSSNGASLAVYPDEDERDDLRFTYVLDYGLQASIGRQNHSVVLTPETFVAEIAECRTFLLEEEALELRRHGIGLRTRVTDLVVFGPRGPIDNRLRFANEPARHKILDLVGDLALLGHDLRGHVVAYRSGHPLNVELVRELKSRLPQVQESMAA
jgi:UDP-3-O-acyl N-acetylglucosamine deacetylase